ncbi:MAG: hypothetical protein U0325_23830 [Polyangiales bacterium]
MGGSRANFGVQRLEPGFVPDPRRVAVVSGGALNARALGLGPGCVGWVTAQPDVIVRLTGPSANLRFYALAADGTDITLLVNANRSAWRCNDDSFGGTNPSVDLGNAAAGQYDIWVGSFREGTTARATLHITELATNHP